MVKLKIATQIVEGANGRCIVLMQILQQDENDRSLSLLKLGNNYFAMAATMFPCFSYESLYIRGRNNHRDSNICSVSVDSLSEATDLCTKLSRTVAAFNIFRHPEPDDTPNDSTWQVHE